MRDPVPSLEPRTGDYAEMLRRARRRRTRRYAVGATSAPAVALAVALAAATPHGAASLRVADSPLPPLPGPVASLLPTPSPTPSPKPKPTVSPSPTDDPKPGNGNPPDHPTPDPDGPHGSPTPSPTQTPYQPPFYEYVHGGAPSKCSSPNATGTSTSPLSGPTNWCVTYTGNTSFAPGEKGVLPIRICRSTDLGVEAGTLTRDPYWFKLGVQPGSPYGRGWYTHDRDVPDATITVQPGDCAQWTSVWNTSDNYGVPLDPGSYTVYVSFLIKEYHPGSPAKFPITVTG